MKVKIYLLLVLFLAGVGVNQLAAQNKATHVKDTVVIELPKDPKQLDIMEFNLKHRNTLSLNLFSLATFAMPAVMYEYTLNESIGLGARASLQFEMFEDYDFGWGKLENTQVHAFTRWHFKPSKFFGSRHYSSFFIEGSLGFKHSNNYVYLTPPAGSVGTDNIIARKDGQGYGFGMGAGAGWRLQSANGRWIGEISLTMGRIMFGNGFMDNPLLYSGGLMIGYRF